MTPKERILELIDPTGTKTWDDFGQKGITTEDVVLGILAYLDEQAAT